MTNVKETWRYRWSWSDWEQNPFHDNKLGIRIFRSKFLSLYCFSLIPSCQPCFVSVLSVATFCFSKFCHIYSEEAKDSQSKYCTRLCAIQSTIHRSRINVSIQWSNRKWKHQVITPPSFRNISLQVPVSYRIVSCRIVADFVISATIIQRINIISYHKVQNVSIRLNFTFVEV